jgi:hypothetical protein
VKQLLDDHMVEEPLDLSEEEEDTEETAATRKVLHETAANEPAGGGEGAEQAEARKLMGEVEANSADEQFSGKVP